MFAACYCGDPRDAHVHLDARRQFGSPYGEHIGLPPYVTWQQAFDPLLTPGARNYWKSHNFSEHAMAYGHRDARFVMNVHGRWDDRADDARCIAWARHFFNAAAPYASAGAYVDFMTEEEGSRVAAAYGQLRAVGRAETQI